MPCKPGREQIDTSGGKISRTKIWYDNGPNSKNQRTLKTNSTGQWMTEGSCLTISLKQVDW